MLLFNNSPASHPAPALQHAFPGSLLRCLLAMTGLLLAQLSQAQIDQGKTGMWYSYAWTDTFTGSRFGWQGDIQRRNFDVDGDLEQMLVRTGLTWTPEGSRIRYTLGLSHIRTGTFGPSANDSEERRLYQEASLGHTVGERLLFTHRLRLEQRWLDGQDQRNRVRYYLGLNVPLNNTRLVKGTLYLALYNELFMNLESDIGNNRSVNYFDRNRFHAGLGYNLSDSSRVQVGYMHQETATVGKGQVQLSVNQSF